MKHFYNVHFWLLALCCLLVVLWLVTVCSWFIRPVQWSTYFEHVIYCVENLMNSQFRCFWFHSMNANLKILFEVHLNERWRVGKKHHVVLFSIWRLFEVSKTRISLKRFPETFDTQTFQIKIIQQNNFWNIFRLGISKFLNASWALKSTGKFIGKWENWI